MAGAPPGMGPAPPIRGGACGGRAASVAGVGVPFMPAIFTLRGLPSILRQSKTDTAVSAWSFCAK